MPKITTAKWRIPPRLTAPIASGPSPPTMSVSTTPIAIQLSSEAR